MIVAQYPSFASSDDMSMFDLAPVSLWLEDASDVKRLFQAWAVSGMTSLRERLAQPECMSECLSRLKILKVNRKTLDLFEAADFPQFLANLPDILTVHSITSMIEQWAQLWEGQTGFFGKTVNTTSSGRVLDVQIRGNLLPGHEADWSRVLVTIEDVTDLEAARRATVASEIYARGLFENSPVSLWVKDFSAVKPLLDNARAAGVVDLDGYFRADSDFAQRCRDAVQVIDVNRQAQRLFGFDDKDSLLRFVREDNSSYRQELQSKIVALWEGKLFLQRDGVIQTLDARYIHVQTQFSVLPGHEKDWAKIQIAHIDISRRKKAEDHLRYVGSHDPLTGLHNRSFFIEKIDELDNERQNSVTIVMIDLNGLKIVNDSLGHASGDDMLRRMGKVLRELADQPVLAARIGGDEFVLMMPGAGKSEAKAMVRALRNRVALDNQASSAHPLSLSVGTATRQSEERLEAVVNRADRSMYQAKKSFYALQAGGAPAPVVRPASCSTEASTEALLALRGVALGRA